MFDVLIIGGGASGVSCALVLGSAHKKAYAADKRIGVITHQKASALQDAVFYNAYGVPSGKLGSAIMAESLEQLKINYPHVEQIEKEKVMKIEGITGNFNVITNKNSYKTKIIVLAVGSSGSFFIEGLMDYVIPHKKAVPEKNRIQLRNEDHLVTEGVYVAGTLAGWRSQFSIAAGSGAAVATDILTLWNSGIHSQHHDSIRK